MNCTNNNWFHKTNVELGQEEQVSQFHSCVPQGLCLLEPEVRPSYDSDWTEPYTNRASGLTTQNEVRGTAEPLPTLFFQLSSGAEGGDCSISCTTAGGDVLSSVQEGKGVAVPRRKKVHFPVEQTVPTVFYLCPHVS